MILMVTILKDNYQSSFRYNEFYSIVKLTNTNKTTF